MTKSDNTKPEVVSDIAPVPHQRRTASQSDGSHHTLHTAGMCQPKYLKTVRPLPVHNHHSISLYNLGSLDHSIGKKVNMQKNFVTAYSASVTIPYLSLSS